MLAKVTVIFTILQICFIDGISGDLRATIAVFSGRKDPTWQIQANNPSYKEIQRLLKEARSLKLNALPQNMPSRLGYKGFLVKDTGMRNQPEELIIGPKTVKLQQLLLETVPTNILPEGDRKAILDEINSGTVVADLQVTKRLAPDYFPSDWNGRPVRLLNNNCYNYANNKPTDTFALPGLAHFLAGGGIEDDYNLPITAAAVQAAAVNDGLQIVNVPPPPQGPFVKNRLPRLPKGSPRHLVALVVDPDRPGYFGDFHWYRLDSDGKWSHKPGETRVTQYDNAGHYITDPRDPSVNMGRYRFVCFMSTNVDTVNIH